MKISTTTVKLTVFMHWKLFCDANCCCSASWNCFADLTSTSILVLQILESPQRVVSLYNYMHMIESNWIIQPFDNRVKRLYCFYFKTESTLISGHFWVIHCSWTTSVAVRAKLQYLLLVGSKTSRSLIWAIIGGLIDHLENLPL